MRVSLRWRENRAMSSNRSASRCPLGLRAPIIITSATILSVEKTSTLVCLEALWAEWPSFIAATCKYKDLIGSPVRKCAAVLSERIPSARTDGNLGNDTESPAGLSARLDGAQISTQLRRTSTASSTRTHTLADTNLQHHFKHPLSPSTSHSIWAVRVWLSA